MATINSFFDYVFYRVAKAYFKWDGKSGATGVVAVTMIQMITVIDIVALCMRLFFPRDYFASYAQAITITVSTAIVVVSILNYIKYSGRYVELKKEWANEPRLRSIAKGWLVLVSMVVPWAILIAIINLL